MCEDGNEGIYLSILLTRGVPTARRTDLAMAGVGYVGGRDVMKSTRCVSHNPHIFAKVYRLFRADVLYFVRLTTLYHALIDARFIARPFFDAP